MLIRSIGVLCLIVLLSACSGRDSSDRSNQVIADNSELVFKAVTNASVATRQRLLNHMTDNYLWYNDLPALNLQEAQYSDLRILLEDLRKIPEDRFSSLANAQLQSQRFEQGVTGSFGLRFSEVATDPVDVRITSVQDFSSVGLAGLQRGDRILGTPEQSIDELGIEGLQELFAEPGLGVERTLLIRHPDGREQSYTISRTQHNLSPVRKAKVFIDEVSGRRTGYLQVEEFISLTSVQLGDVRNQFAFASLDDLILDLRYNGGGLIAASRDLASSLYGESQSSDVYSVLQHNDKHSSDDFTFNYRQLQNALTGLERVFVLTTGNTCSASEEVINGLKPFMEVITIGETTCGKPYASRPFELVPELVNANILDSRSVNATGEGDFFDGFTPTCAANDNPVLPFTDPEESLIRVALYYAENTRCPVQLSDPASSLRRTGKSVELIPAGDPVRASGAVILPADVSVGE